MPITEVWRRGLKEVMKSKEGKFAYDKLPDVVSFAKLLMLDVIPEELIQEQGSKNGKKNPGISRGHSPISHGEQKGAKRKEPKNKNKSGKGEGPDRGKGEGKGNGKNQNKPKSEGKGKGPGKGN